MLGLDQQLHWGSFAFGFALASQRSSEQTIACGAVHSTGACGGPGSCALVSMLAGVHAVSLHETRTWLSGNALRR